MSEHLSQPGPAFDDLLVTAAGWLLAATLLWGAAVLVAALVERGSRGRLPALHWVGCPHRARPLLLAAMGLAVLLPGAAAHAATDRPGQDGGALPAPTRPVDDGTAVRVPGPAPRPAPADTPGRATTLAVRPGDSLWALARVRLGPRAGDPDVARLVARVHHRNRAVVGPDADLLRPGQQLRFPATPPPPPEAP